MRHQMKVFSCWKLKQHANVRRFFSRNWCLRYIDGVGESSWNINTVYNRWTGLYIFHGYLLQIATPFTRRFCRNEMSNNRLPTPHALYVHVLSFTHFCPVDYSIIMNWMSSFINIRCLVNWMSSFINIRCLVYFIFQS